MQPEHPCTCRYSHESNSIAVTSLPTLHVAAETGYRALVEHLPAVTYVEELDGGALRYISPRVAAMTGYPPEEWVTDAGRWRECLHPDDRERVIAAIEQFQHTPAMERDVLTLEYRLLARDSRTIWVRDERRVVRDSAGTPLYVQGIALDISEYKQMEAKLRHSEARFRSLVQNISDVISIYGPDGALHYVSPALARVVDYDPADHSALTIVHPEDRRLARDIIRRALADPEDHTPVTLRVRHRDGSWRFIEAVAHNMLHEPSVQGIVLISREITERLAAEAERERLRLEALARRREVEILLEISTALNAAETEEAMLHAVAARIARLCDAEDASVGLLRDNALALVRYYQDGRWEERRYVPPTSGSIISHVIATRRAYLCNDLAHDPLSDHATDADRGFRSQISVPLLGADGNVLGVLNLFNKRAGGYFTEHDLALAETVATEMGVALERARSRAQLAATIDALRQSEARFRSLVQNGSDIIVLVGADDIVQYISPSIERLTGYRPEDVLGTNAYGWVHPDDRAGAKRTLRQRLVEPEGMQSGVRASLRLLHKDGSSRHVDLLATNLLHEPSVRGVVINMRDITERVALEEALSRQAFHDALTGLPNRALFMERLSHTLLRAGRRSSGAAVLYLDLDGFKVINDSLGHAAGDLLLIAAGRRIAACVRPSDTVARFGGDEFAVLLEDIAHPEDAPRVAARIVAELRRPFLVEGREVFVTASLGITYHDRRHTRPDDLLREADIALYEAKAGGKSRAVVFDPQMNARALERLELETDLRHAVERGELYLEYQPIVEVRGGTVLGVEALVRWQHPVRGVIAPTEFIPIAEETGLILAIGRWTLREACRQARAWLPLRPEGRAVTMSVNLSARQFQQPDLVQQVADVLEHTGLPPACLCLEITEGTAMADAASTIRTLTALKALGVQIAIDDFGTGYSSLAYLRHFPVDMLKVDRSFIGGLEHDAKTTAIVRTIVRLSHALGIKVTAEGIESAGQAARLRKMACDRGQGYYFARPLAAEAIPELVIGGDTRAYLLPRTRARKIALPRAG